PVHCHNTSLAELLDATQILLNYYEWQLLRLDCSAYAPVANYYRVPLQAFSGSEFRGHRQSVLWPFQPGEQSRTTAQPAGQGINRREGEGFNMIESSAPAMTKSRPSGGKTPNTTPSPARMKENSPI